MLYLLLLIVFLSATQIELLIMVDDAAKRKIKYLFARCYDKLSFDLFPTIIYWIINEKTYKISNSMLNQTLMIVERMEELKVELNDLYLNILHLRTRLHYTDTILEYSRYDSVEFTSVCLSVCVAVVVVSSSLDDRKSNHNTGTMLLHTKSSSVS